MLRKILEYPELEKPEVIVIGTKQHALYIELLSLGDFQPASRLSPKFGPWTNQTLEILARKGWADKKIDGDSWAVGRPVVSYRAKPLEVTEASLVLSLKQQRADEEAELEEAYWKRVGVDPSMLNFRTENEIFELTSSQRDKDENQSYLVYFVEALGLNVVKIGMTRTSLLRRVEMWRSGTPAVLNVLYYLPGIDHHWHAALDRYRVCREWFEADAIKSHLDVVDPNWRDFSFYVPEKRIHQQHRKGKRG